MLVKLIEQDAGGIGNGGSRREDGGDAMLAEPFGILLRNDAAGDNHDVVAPQSLERRPERWKQDQMSGGHRRDADHMDIAARRLAGHFLGRGKKRAGDDLETHIGESRSDDLLAAVMAILPDLGDENARR